ncbi:HEAT repeat protein [Dictyocaulus viviparus]|uniref:HEAT repeat protein n=1 Tax=Dictyocaulus viviparus TaxID=29172 RepID=A0A0D8XLC4_DICVI|nr:HEAT repeat protein [Dictyocaulus viviparus]
MQDIASSGISLVYEMASPEQRKELVSTLIPQILEGKVSLNTETGSSKVISDENQRTVAIESQNLTTYKEMCYLANDLNQPDMIYKFISLARHNPLWNFKKGSVFEFNIVLGQATVELDPFISILIPKLFRYRYDPDLGVRKSMSSIWSALTASRHNLVEEYVEDVAKELTQQLTHPQWRVRQSACLALADLVRTNDSAYIRSIIPKLIPDIFRLLDDMKESVRQAAEHAFTSLRKLIVRLSSQSFNGHDSRGFVSALIPVLIHHGVSSKISKELSMSLLLELAKTAKTQIQPYLSELIPSLIDSISDTEPQILNYVAARSNLVELEVLDDTRTQIALTSPLMTAIHELLPQIDSSVLVSLQPQICERLRSCAGVSSRVACAQLLVILALRSPHLLENTVICDRFFNALIIGTRDRNPSVQKNFSNAVSYMAKYASSSCFEKLIKNIVKDLSEGDEPKKQSAKCLLKNLYVNCSELLQGYSKIIIPYVFLETCQLVIPGDVSSNKRYEEWQQLWSEIVPSTEAAIRLYGSEMIDLTMDILRRNDVWAVRAQAARMLHRIVEHPQNGMNDADAAQLLSDLMPMMSGRIWHGKEHLISAISAIIFCAGQSLYHNWTVRNIEELFALLKKEASKAKRNYAAVALVTCGVFARSLSHTMAADWLFEKVNGNLRIVGNNSNDSDSEDDETNPLTREARVSEFMCQNMTAVVKAAGAYFEERRALFALDSFGSYLTSPNILFKPKQALVLALLELMNSWQLKSVLDVTEFIGSLLMLAEQLIAQQKKSLATQCFNIIMIISRRRDVYAVQWDVIKAKWEKNEALREISLFPKFMELNMNIV